jgi:hypothetical protein
MRWFKKKDYTDYQRLWTIGEIKIGDIPIDYIYHFGRNASGKAPTFEFWKACELEMERRRSKLNNQHERKACELEIKRRRSELNGQPEKEASQ